MMKLVAFVDGSTYSKSVCELAAWVAKRTGSQVDIVHVLGRNPATDKASDLSGSIGLGARTALLSELAELDGQMARLSHQRGRAILEDAKHILVDQGITDVTTFLRNEGIVEATRNFETDAGLIVIGKRGEGSESNDEHLGSSLERVVRASHKPVMVASRALKPIQRVLIAFDGGTSALKAVNYLAQNPVFSDLDCLLLTVGSPKEAAKVQLDEAAKALRASGYKIETQVENGQPEAVITETIEKQNIDLLLMGAYGHSRIRSLIIGSTTTSMLSACKIPVLLFR